MAIVDVDAHYEPAPDWLDDFPSLRDRLPRRLPDDDPRFEISSPEQFAWFVSDDVLRAVPPERRMAMEKIPPAMRCERVAVAADHVLHRDALLVRTAR